MSDDDIVRIPSNNKRLGSCPECGGPVWESDRLLSNGVIVPRVYRCLKCRRVISLDDDDIIPF